MSEECEIIRIDAGSYPHFADMVYWREHGVQREPKFVLTPAELTKVRLSL